LKRFGSITRLDGRYLQAIKQYGLFKANPYGKEKEQSM